MSEISWIPVMGGVMLLLAKALLDSMKARNGHAPATTKTVEDVHKCLETRIDRVEKRIGGNSDDRPISEQLAVLDERTGRIDKFIENYAERRKTERSSGRS